MSWIAIGILGASLVIPASGAAVVVLPGSLPHAEDLAGVRFRSFANTGGHEIYTGIPDLGIATYRAQENGTWQSGSNDVSFIFDRTNDRLIATVSNGSGTFSTTYNNISTFLVPAGKTQTLDDLDSVHIHVVARDAGTTVDFVDVDLSGNALGDFIGVPGAWTTWTVRDFDFTQDFTITGRIVLSGPFGFSQELSKVQIDVGKLQGCASDADCNDGEFCNGDETCNTTTGQCLPGTFRDGEACEDGDQCTVSGTCLGGVCDASIGPGLVVSGRSFVARDSALNMDLYIDNDDGRMIVGRGTVIADGTLLSAHRVLLLGGASVYDVQYNFIVPPGVAPGVPGSAGQQIRNSAVAVFTPYGPSASPFCSVPPFICGGANVVVPPGEVQSLAPGTYGQIAVGTGGTLEVAGGEYVACRVTLARDAKMVAQPGAGEAVLKVATRFTGRRGARIEAAPGAARLRIMTPRVAFARGTSLIAHLVSPNGRVRVGSDSTFNGTACAYRLIGFRRSTLGCTPVP